MIELFFYLFYFIVKQVSPNQTYKKKNITDENNSVDLWRLELIFLLKQSIIVGWRETCTRQEIVKIEKVALEVACHKA